MTRQIGYCTNVHAGRDLANTRANLERHALAVRAQLGLDRPLGIGLWLSAAAAEELLGDERLAEFAGWLSESGLRPFTLNGFPYGDFHQPVVKHAVYLPTWCEAARVDYTLNLIRILDRLLPAGEEGSISTLPLQWGTPRLTQDQWTQSAANLRLTAARLAELERETGRLIYLCIEPEPGCALQRSDDILRYFKAFLLGGDDEPAVRRHLRVCHDVCHAAVMFEEQADVLQRFRSAGIGVGKVQVSSAVVIDWDDIAPGEREAALRQLGGFAEDRYLHQTMVRPSVDDDPIFFEDLPAAMRCVENATELTGEWRVHFHVPVYLEQFGWLKTSRPDILRCLDAARLHPELTHFEVETYAWGVLPDELRQPDLASGIAAELRWFHSFQPVACL